MVSETGIRDSTAVAAHPLAELLACPPQAADLLACASQLVRFAPAYVVFRQNETCKGLYLLLSGGFACTAERRKRQLRLGTVRSGDVVELSAALGVWRHTYTLTSVTDGSLLLLPIEFLNRAFALHPPLRMHLLEELAREVSRAYFACCASPIVSRIGRSAKAR
jgi:CRP-like cAMP-binding protein